MRANKQRVDTCGVAADLLHLSPCTKLRPVPHQPRRADAERREADTCRGVNLKATRCKQPRKGPAQPPQQSTGLSRFANGKRQARDAGTAKMDFIAAPLRAPQCCLSFDEALMGV